MATNAIGKRISVHPPSGSPEAPIHTGEITGEDIISPDVVMAAVAPRAMSSGGVGAATRKAMESLAIRDATLEDRPKPNTPLGYGGPPNNYEDHHLGF